jgi:cytochrome c oxidase subunit III
MSDAAAPHTFQFSSARHQSQSAIAGMWLFLASEVLFFGALFLAWIICRHGNQAGFDAGAQQTSLLLGGINTIILITSSAAYSTGVLYASAGNSRRLIQFCSLAWLLGFAFLVLKFGVEWREDFGKHLFPGPNFALQGPLGHGAQLFFVFYFLGTAIHGLHMIVGLILVAWIVWRARRGDFSAQYSTPAAAVGLYWSFVDMVWMVLFPLIYLVGRAP